MPWPAGHKIGEADVSGLPGTESELREVLAQSSYMAPVVKGWAAEHAEGIWKAMYAWQFEMQDRARKADGICVVDGRDPVSDEDQF